MVHVEVGAQHGVDRLARISRRREVIQKRPVQIVPRRDPPVLLVVAKARIHHDPPRRRLHHEAVDAHAQPAILVGEMRAQPGDRLDFLARRLRQDEAAAAGHLQLDNFGHRHVADPPLHRCLPPCADPPAVSRSAPTREETEVAQHIDYYASLNSPWTHLGAARIEALAAKHGASLRIWPVDFGTVFAGSGGLPLPKRAPQRQAYRLMELRRWRDFLGVPINIEPKFFPASEALTGPCVIALRETQGDAPPSSWRIACCARCGRTS